MSNEGWKRLKQTLGGIAIITLLALFVAGMLSEPSSAEAAMAGVAVGGSIGIIIAWMDSL